MANNLRISSPPCMDWIDKYSYRRRVELCGSLLAPAQLTFIAPTRRLPGFWKQQCPPGYARASHILFLKTDDDAEGKADAVLAQINAGTVSFENAALQFSVCPTREQLPPGDLGTFASLSNMREVDEMRSFEGTMLLPYEGLDTNAFDDAVFAAPLNTPQKVASQWGWHIILVRERGDGPRAMTAPETPPVSLDELKVKPSDDAGKSM